MSIPFTREQTRLRSPAVFLALAAATIVLGLATRRFRGSLPAAVGLYAGDVLWATMVYLLLAAIWPRASIRRLAAGAAAFALVIEVGQLYHAPWIDAVRDTRLGGLVLGFGFLWSDLACYAVGIALAVALDAWIGRWGMGKPDRHIVTGAEGTGMRSDVSQRLAETIAWCSLRADPADPDQSTRTPDFLPPLLAGDGVLKRAYDSGFVGVQQAVDFICERRREALVKAGIHVVSDSPDLAGGRVISTDFGSDWCVVAQPESNGFFDADDLPGWDTWFHCARIGRSEFQVFCWVPPQLVELADRGIEVLPIPCVRWVDDSREWASAAGP